MKTYRVKNYKGNLVESLKKFSDSYKGMKIVEACEDGYDLKIKVEESKQKVNEASIETIAYNVSDLIKALKEIEQKYSSQIKDMAIVFAPGWEDDDGEWGEPRSISIMRPRKDYHDRYTIAKEIDKKYIQAIEKIGKVL